ncbi:unnamed protein product [Arctogadus glacialis]
MYVPRETDHTEAPLDLDNICVGRGGGGDPRRGRRGSQDPRLAPAAAPAAATLEQKWGGVASELRCRGGRMRSAVYQTSDLPSVVAVKVGADDAPEARRNGHLDRSNFKATFPPGASRPGGPHSLQGPRDRGALTASRGLETGGPSQPPGASRPGAPHSLRGASRPGGPHGLQGPRDRGALTASRGLETGGPSQPPGASRPGGPHSLQGPSQPPGASRPGGPHSLQGPRDRGALTASRGLKTGGPLSLQRPRDRGALTASRSLETGGPSQPPGASRPGGPHSLPGPSQPPGTSRPGGPPHNLQGPRGPEAPHSLQLRLLSLAGGLLPGGREIRTSGSEGDRRDRRPPPGPPWGQWETDQYMLKTDQSLGQTSRFLNFLSL